MIDKDKIIFICNYFRRSFFFEDSVQRILNKGYRVILQHTGSSNLFGPIGISHPNLQFIDTRGQMAYDAGMVRFRSQNIVLDQYEYIVLIDNDLFFSGTDELEEYLQEFIDGDYDFACHLVGHTDSEKYDYGDRQIAEVTDQSFGPAGLEGLPDILTPIPYWENAYLIMKNSLWKKMTPHDVSHHRRFIMAVDRENAKLGSHKADYRWDYTQWGKEWFHVGNLMPYHLDVERGNVARFNPESDFDMFRAGYFLAQEDIYGSEIYVQQLRSTLGIIYERMGGPGKVREKWNEIVDGTCLKGWEKLER